MGNPMENLPNEETKKYTTYEEVNNRYNYLGEQIRKFEQNEMSDLDENSIKNAEKELEELREKLEELKEKE